MTGVLIRKGKFRYKYKQREDGHAKTAQEKSYVATNQKTQSIAKNHQKLGQGKERVSPENFRRNMNLTKP